MTPPQAKRLSEDRLENILDAIASRHSQAAYHALRDHIAALEAKYEALGTECMAVKDAYDTLNAAAAAREEQVRELVEACRQLLGDEDECYEPGKCLVTADAMKRIRVALTTGETDDH